MTPVNESVESIKAHIEQAEAAKAIALARACRTGDDEDYEAFDRARKRVAQLQTLYAYARNP